MTAIRMKPQFVGRWRLTEMEAWDSDYINLTGPGYLKIDRDGGGFMQFGAVEAALDCRAEDMGDKRRLEFSFRGSDEGDPISGRGWATVSGDEITGRIYFHQGDESGFIATKDKAAKDDRQSTANVIRLPKNIAVAHSKKAGPHRKKIKYGQPVEIRFSRAEKVLLQEHTFMDADYTKRIRPADKGKALVGHYTLDDLEDMIGYIAAEANHTTDKKLQRKLDSLFSRLQDEMESYDDGA